MNTASIMKLWKSFLAAFFKLRHKLLLQMFLLYMNRISHQSISRAAALKEDFAEEMSANVDKINTRNWWIIGSVCNFPSERIVLS